MLAHGRVSLSVVIYYFRAQFIFYDLYALEFKILGKG